MKPAAPVTITGKSAPQPLGELGPSIGPSSRRVDTATAPGRGSSAGFAGNHIGVAQRIEQKLVCSIDAGDNGVETYASVSDVLFPFTIQAAFGSFMPTWKHPAVTKDQFLSAVKIAESILRREILQAKDFFEAEGHIQAIYEKTEDRRILVLDRMYPWEEITVKYPEPLFVVASRDGSNWKAEGVLVGKGFARRIYFPQAWAGLRDEELEEASGVPGAVFCHNGRFIATAKTKKAALALAKLALNE